MLRCIYCFLVLFMIIINAQEQDIEISILEKNVARRDSIVTLQVVLKTKVSLEGKLSFYENEILFYQTDTLIISSQTANRYEVIIPPSYTYAGFKWDAFFETKENKYPLGIINIATTDILVTSTQSSISEVEKTILAPIPKIEKHRQQINGLEHYKLDAQLKLTKSIPKFYWGYLQSHIVVIDSQTLSLMGKDEFSALNTWVKMGGSLCISIDFPPQLQENFLANIQECPSFTVEKDTGFSAYYYGWGRVVLWDMSVNPNIDLQSNVTWQRCILFLHKLHLETISDILFDKLDAQDALYYKRTDEELPLSRISSYLLPETIQIVPTFIITILLIIFLVLVGPVEYIVLKKMRKLVLTWITLPIMTLLFWLLCHWLASVYMGDSGGCKSLEIINLDHNGNIVSCDQISLSVYPLATDIHNDMTNSICSNIKNIQLRHYSSNVFNSGDTVEYQGKFPLNYTTKRYCQPWTSYVERNFKDGSNQKIDNIIYLAEIKETMKKLSSNRINYDYGAEKRIHFKHVDEIMYFEDIEHVSVIHQGELYILKNIPHRNNKKDYRSRYYELDLFESIVSLNFLAQKDVFCQFSPGGCSSIRNDIIVHDPSNKNQYILIWIRTEEEKIIVYRQLFYDTTP